MLKPLGDNAKIKELGELIARNDRFVITCHIAPDGDAIGSSLALYNLLSVLGKDVKVVTPDIVQDNLMVLPGAKEIVVFTRYTEFVNELLSKADVVFSLDYNALNRIDRLGEPLLKSPAKKVLIDHHLHPEDFPDIVISHPECSSTSALLFKVICELGLLQLVDKGIGSCIYAGMMTDTGNFSYNSNDPELYYIIAKLVETGVDKDDLYAKIVNASTLSKLKITAYAIDRKLTLYPEHRAALIVLSRNELNQFHYKKGDTESLVNIPLRLQDVDYCFFLREEAEYIKVSSRSKGEFPVNEICSRYFNGGGHRNAAGGEFRGTMKECVKRFESILGECDKLLNGNQEEII